MMNSISKTGCLLPLLLLCFTGSLHAQPNVELHAETLNNYESILFTFKQDDIQSMEGCHYNLFAGRSRKDLAKLPGKGLSIATFFRPLSEIQIIAGPLPHLKKLFGKNEPKNTKYVKLFFRTLLSCPDATNGLGEIINLKIKTFKDGQTKTINSYRKSMKYHMQYYNP